MIVQKDIAVLLAVNHHLLRTQIRKIIDKQENQTVIGEVTTGKEMLTFARENDPKVLVLDINLPDMDGIEATVNINSIIPQAVVIGLIMDRNPNVLEPIHNIGASACIRKDEVFVKLCTTIQKEVFAK